MGIRVYVIDTGVQASHKEFWTSDLDHTSRVADGWDMQCLGCEKDPYSICNSTSWDLGHGTAVASIVAGLKTGVAKGVTIVPIRAFDCVSRTDSATIRRALDAIEALEMQRVLAQPGTMAIVNMSWYFELTKTGATLVEDKIRALIANPETDLLFVTSANNKAGDADNYIPSRMSEVFTVAASTATDGHWVDSNYGPEVDLYAPGDDIDAAHIGPTDDAYRAGLKSGTSFSAAMVSGVAARYAQGELFDSGQVWQRLLDGSFSRISNPPPGTTDKLLIKRDRCRLVPR